MSASAGGVRAGKAFVELGANDSKLQAALVAVKGRLTAWGHQLARLGGFEFAALGTAKIAPVFLALRSLVNEAGGLSRVATQVGVNAEELSRWAYVAAETNVALADVVNGFQRMRSVTIAAAQNDHEAVRSLIAVGRASRGVAYSFQEWERLRPQDQLLAVAQAAERITNVNARRAFLEQLLGNPDALAPMLARGEAGIRRLRSASDELGATMSGPEARGAEDLRRAWASLTAQLNRAWTSIGLGLVGPMTGLARWLGGQVRAVTDWLRANQEVVAHLVAEALAFIAGGVAVGAFGVALMAAGTAVGYLSAGLAVLSAVLGTVAGVVRVAAGGFGLLRAVVAGGALALGVLRTAAFATVGGFGLLRTVVAGTVAALGILKTVAFATAGATYALVIAMTTATSVLTMAWAAAVATATALRSLYLAMTTARSGTILFLRSVAALQATLVVLKATVLALTAWPVVLAAGAAALVMYTETGRGLVAGLAAAFRGMANWFTGAFGAVASAVGGAFRSVASAAGGVAAAAGSAFRSVASAATDAFGYVASSAAAGWGHLREDGTEAFGAIAAAIQGGNIQAATQVLWAFMRLEWARGTNWLRGAWNDFQAYWAEAIGAVQVAWSGAVASMRAVFEPFVAWVRLLWAQVGGSMSSGVQGMVASTEEVRGTWADAFLYMHNVFARFIAAIRLLWNAAASNLASGVLRLAANAAALVGMADRARAFREQAADVDRQRGAKDEEIKAEFDKGVNDRQRAQEWARTARAIERARRLAAGDGGAGEDAARALAEAQQALADAVAAARQPVGAAPPGNSRTDPNSAQGGQGGLRPGIGNLGLSSVRQAIGGTFNAFAVRGLGSSGGPMERTARATEETARNTRRRQDGPVANATPVFA